MVANKERWRCLRRSFWGGGACAGVFGSLPTGRTAACLTRCLGASEKRTKGEDDAARLVGVCFGLLPGAGDDIKRYRPAGDAVRLLTLSFCCRGQVTLSDLDDETTVQEIEVNPALLFALVHTLMYARAHWYYGDLVLCSTLSHTCRHCHVL